MRSAFDGFDGDYSSNRQINDGEGMNIDDEEYARRLME
jgi:hypothetical protein